MFREEERNQERWFTHPDLYLDNSSIPGAGTGIFSKIDIPAYTLVESSPVIVCARDSFRTLNAIHPKVRHILSDYQFEWDSWSAVICLGWGSIFNHSFEPNCRWHTIKEDEHGYNAMWFRTKRDVKAGEELFVRYCWDADRLWFVDDSVEQSNHPTLNKQVRSKGTFTMQTEHYFNRAARVYDVASRGHNIETLGDYRTVTKIKKTKTEEE